MNTSAAKNNILKKIKQALGNPVPVPFPQQPSSGEVFHPSVQDLEVEFAENFTNLQGRFSFCENEQELTAQLAALFAARKWTQVYCREQALVQLMAQPPVNLVPFKDLTNCQVSVTGCETLVARTGTIVLSSAQQSGRTVSVYAPVHVCIAYTNQLVYDISESLRQVQQKYANLPSLISFASGPSRTADIEKTLVTGVHGPKEVFCFLVEQPAAATE